MGFKSFIGLLLCLSSSISLGKIQIKKWNQKTAISSDGKILNLSISTEVNGLKKNQYYDNWGYNFPKSQDITILDTYMGDKNYSSDFKDNTIRFKFSPAKNGEKLVFQINYMINKKLTDHYVKHDFLTAPAFAAGARASVTVTYPRDLTHYSSHKRFKSCGKSCLKWKGTIPQDGVSESLDLTHREMLFRASISHEFSSQDKLSALKVKLPNYFAFGPDPIKSLNIETNYDSTRSEADDHIQYSFDKLDNFNLSIDLEAKVLSKARAIFPSSHWDKQDGLSIDKDELEFANQVLAKISNTRKNKEAPLYAQISRWVYQHINYDLDCLGKDISNKDIYEDKKGVCLHFAQLCTLLLRAAKIPAFLIYGLAYDSGLGRLAPHAWVLVKHNNKWIGIDPTWDIDSGKLPVSHIYTGWNNKTNYRMTYYKTKPTLNHHSESDAQKI